MTVDSKGTETQQNDDSTTLDASVEPQATATGEHSSFGGGSTANATLGAETQETPSSGSTVSATTPSEPTTSEPSSGEQGQGSETGASSTPDTTTTETNTDSGSDLFQVEVHLASEDDPKAPTTVGIVTWSTSMGTPSSATIEFGLSTDYAWQAPVNVAAPDFRTLLLGMKPDQTYHFRIVAQVDGQDITSRDYSLTTGSVPSFLEETMQFAVLSDEAREPGFIVTSYWGESQSGMVFILDAEGDIVWWYDSGIQAGVGKAAISDDGQDLWMITAAPTQNEPLLRVGMDGLGVETYANIAGTHDIVPVEGDVMAFVALYTAYEVDRQGQTKTILPPLEINTTPLPHCNAIAYNKTTATYAISNLSADVYIFPRSGAAPEDTLLLSSLVVSNPNWDAYQHGVQLLTNNHLLMFANNEGIDETDPARRMSTAIEYDLDNGEEVWRYEGRQYTANYGGVQRLPGGNTLVTYSNAGVIHETTSDGQKVLELTANQKLGYATWRPSLYGSAADAEQ